MTDEEQTAPEADEQQDAGAPAQTVRVPNVRPGAKSGLDHTVIGSDALAPDVDDDEPLEVPDGDLDSQIAWVAAAEDQGEAHDRADAVYTKQEDDGADGGSLEALSARLREAVYGTGDGEGEDPQEGGDSGLQSDPGSEVAGSLEETDGQGDAENAETGEVTPAGEPLPEVQDQGGEPIDSPAAEEGDGSH